MANTIRIKRSASTNVPAANLAQGELANSETGSPNGLNELYIGVTGPSNFKLIRNLNAAPAEPTAGLAAATPVTADYMVFEDVTDSQGKRVLFSATPLSIFDNDSGWNNYVHPNHSGHVTSVADGATTLVVAAITGQTDIGADLVATDEIVVSDNGVIRRADISRFLTYFNGALSFVTAEVDTLALVTGRGATTATASTFSGGINMADSDLNRPVLEDYGVKHTAPTVSTNAVTLDCAVSNSFLVDMDPATAAVTVTLSNPPASGTYGEMTIAIVMGTPAYGITWPGSVTWQGGSAPNLTTTNNSVDLVHLFTVDAGTTWYGTFSLADATAGGGTVTAVTGGNGIDSTGGTTPDISLNLGELGVASPVGGDWIAFDNAGVSNKALISSFDIGLFDNATAEFVSENDTIVVVDWNWVLDEDLMGSDSAVHVATQQSIKAYVDNAVTGALTHKGGYNASTNTPALDTGSPVLEIGDMYTVTVAGTFFTVEVEVGDVLISDVDSVDAANVADWTIVQSNIGAASETVAGYIRIATQAEVDAEASALIAVTPAYLHETTFDGGTF